MTNIKSDIASRFTLINRTHPTKVCIVAPVHIWDDVRVFQKEAVSLARAGYQVTLLAKTDEPRREKNVTVVPVKTSKRHRLLRFLMLPVVFWQALKQRADLYHLHNPDTLPIGFLLKLFGKKVVYDTHEDFSKQILIKGWLPTMLRKPLAAAVGALEQISARFFDGAIATQQDVLSRLGNDAMLIQNPPRTNPQLLKEVEKLKQNISDPFPGFRLIYIGTIAKSRGLYTMVDALELLNRKQEARLWLVGKVDEEQLETARQKEGWKYVDYIPPLPQEQAFAYVALSDLGLIVIDDIGDHKHTDPNKIYEYMTFGIPFIASNFESWMKKLDTANAGWFVQPDSPALLSVKIEEAISSDELRKTYSQNARVFIQNYNWEKESEKLLNLYSAIEEDQ